MPTTCLRIGNSRRSRCGPSFPMCLIPTTFSSMLCSRSAPLGHSLASSFRLSFICNRSAPYTFLFCYSSLRARPVPTVIWKKRLTHDCVTHAIQIIMVTAYFTLRSFLVSRIEYWLTHQDDGPVDRPVGYGERTSPTTTMSRPRSVYLHAYSSNKSATAKLL